MPTRADIRHIGKTRDDLRNLREATAPGKLTTIVVSPPQHIAAATNFFELKSAAQITVNELTRDFNHALAVLIAKLTTQGSLTAESGEH